MRLTMVAVCFLVLASHLSSSAAADVIHLRDGKQVNGRVLEYVDQQIRIETPDGKVITHKMTDVLRIKFARVSKNTEPAVDMLEIDTAIENKIKEVKPSLAAQPGTALVVMYMDATGADAKVPNIGVNYKCYFSSGYSGNRQSPVGRAVVQRERVSKSREVRIQLDPGPAYKMVNRHVTLEPGKIVNLGYIKLEKKQFEGTASIRGFVRDAFGKPISGVKVTAGDQEVVSFDDGSYQLDGFKLEEVLIKTEIEGYHQERTTRVTIRDMKNCLLYTSPSPRDATLSRMPSSA